MNDKPKLQVKFVTPPVMLAASPKTVNKIVMRETPQHTGWVWLCGISATVLVTLGFVAGLVWVLLKYA